MTPNDHHLTDEQLAALVDGRLSADEDRSALEHLARCRTCMATYTATVQSVAEWRHGDTIPAANQGGGHPGRWPRLALAACIPLFVALAAWLAMREPATHPRRPEVVAALTMASHFGMILPQSEFGTFDPPDTVRGIQLHPAQKAVLENLLAANDTIGLDPALIVGSYLALDKPDMPRLQLKEALEIHPDNPDLLVLEGIRLFKESKDGKAQKYFEKALGFAPDHPAAGFNLAYCLWAQNRFTEAANLFEKLATGEPGTLITVRATESLAKVEAQEPIY